MKGQANHLSRDRANTSECSTVQPVPYGASRGSTRIYLRAVCGTSVVSPSVVGWACPRQVLRRWSQAGFESPHSLTSGNAQVYAGVEQATYGEKLGLVVVDTRTTAPHLTECRLAARRIRLPSFLVQQGRHLATSGSEEGSSSLVE